MRVRAAPVWMVCLLMTGCASTASAPSASPALAMADSLGPQVALAHYLHRISAGADIASTVEEAWPLRMRLHDDSVLRDQLELVAGTHVPAPLAASVALQHAQAALSSGATSEASKRAEAGFGPGADGLTAARARLVWALAELGGARRTAAIAALERVADTPEAAALGPIGAELASLARLTLGAAQLDSEDHRAAIGHYLKVPRSSAHWRAARHGLATTQFRAGRPERTLKILALTPGGLAGDPERAVLAAMAAHAVGRPADALAIVDAALSRLPDWRAELATADATLAVIASERGEQPLGRAGESLVHTVANGAAVRSIGRELLAARAQTPPSDHVAPLKRYRDALASRFAAVVRDEARVVADRSREAGRQLTILRPQIQ